VIDVTATEVRDARSGAVHVAFARRVKARSTSCSSRLIHFDKRGIAAPSLTRPVEPRQPNEG
jgi:hypothetical protein